MFQQRIKNVLNEIHSIIELDWNNFISFKQVREWKLNESKDIEGVMNTKIFDSEKHCRFLTIIPPRKSFKIHWHDCLETCTVITGVLADKEKNKSFGMGEVCKYKAFEKHIPYNPSSKHNLYLIVDFYK